MASPEVMTGEETEYKQKTRSRTAQRRQRLKAEGRCQSCGKFSERTLAGMCYCEECQKRRTESERERRRGVPHISTQRQRELRKSRYDALKAKGLCVDCGKEKAEQGRVRCKACLELQSEINVEFRRQKDRRKKELRLMQEKCHGGSDPKDCLNCPLEKCVLDEVEEFAWQKR